MGRLVVHARRRTPFGTISIVRDTVTGALRYSQGSVYQSIADRRGISLAAYTHAIAGFIAQLEVAEVVVIGCAGGTLGRLLDRPRRRVTLLDINPEAFTLARQYYQLPQRVVCQVADGVHFLARSRDSFDAIVVDVCDGMRLPANFSSRKFLRNACRRLQPNGYLFCNVILADDTDSSAQLIARRLAEQLPSVAILDTPGSRWRNAVVVAGPAPLTQPLRLAKRPETGAAELRSQLRAMQLREWQVGAG